MFIIDSSCISPQATIDGKIFEEGDVIAHSERFTAKEPSYKETIPMALLRRMSKLVRMSIGQALPMLQKNEAIEGVIFGSGNGSGENSGKFLNQIIDYKEGTLTPTNFVQSTSNAVAGSIALMGQITGYNNTHVNHSLSFESVLLDALMYTKDNPESKILIGAGEELSYMNYNIDERRGYYKKEIISSDRFYTSHTQGTIPGEGVALFTVTGQKTDEAIAQITDVAMIVSTDLKEITECLERFLLKNNLTNDDIDVVVSGFDGDEERAIAFDTILSKTSTNKPLIGFKHLSGEHLSSAGFATWFASKIIEGKNIPKSCFLNDIKEISAPKTVLIYNSSDCRQHGFILVQKVS